MSTQHVETLIIGAGQAGLATAYHLLRRGRECLVVDANHRVGDNWRSHYDSLRLYSPAKYDGLPGMRFPGEKWNYPGKDEVAEYLETYAVRFDLPVRMGTPVDRLAARPDGGFVARVGEHSITCDNAVVATGTFGRTPNLPDFAAQLDPQISQLHSSEYKRVSQLADGPTLVVGAAHSGCDIAYEIAETRPTTLAGRDCGQVPIPWETRRLRWALPVIVFAWRHVLSRRTPMGRKAMAKVRHHGGPMLRVKRRHLSARGVQRNQSRVVGVTDGKPTLADGTVLEVANVVWCTGFRPRLDWIELPILGEDGWPVEYRGVVGSVPGLFFCGLAFQSAFASTLLLGAGRDAAHVADKIVSRARQLAGQRTQGPAVAA